MKFNYRCLFSASVLRIHFWSFPAGRQPWFSGELITLRSTLSWWARRSATRCRTFPVWVQDPQLFGADAGGTRGRALGPQPVHAPVTGDCGSSTEALGTGSSGFINAELQGSRANGGATGLVIPPMINTIYHVVSRRLLR